jgi:hypothetical protein
VLPAGAARRIVTAVAVAATSVLPSTPSAAPESRDAVIACGATNVTRSDADVHPSIWQAPFLELPGLTIRCGDGHSYGAVHVEVKHNVPNWGDAANCITKAMERTEAETVNGKNIYRYRFNNQLLTVSTGRNGLVTAFPKSNKHATWIECSQS